MFELLNKALDLGNAQPNVAIGLVVAAILLCLAMAPIFAIGLAWYVVRELVRRESEEGKPG